MVALENFRVAIDFIERAGRARTVDALADEFLYSINQLGLERFACICSQPYIAGQEKTLMIARYPDNWSKFYLDGGPNGISGILAEKASGSLPFIWEMEAISRGAPDEADRWYDLDSDTLDFSGFTVPIFVTGAHPGAVNIIGPHACFGDGNQFVLHLMGVYLHDWAMRINYAGFSDPSAADKLTPREVECLRWVSAGKTDWEISGELEISERTVHAHIENAKRKLAVHTRLQAVAAAFLGSPYYSEWPDFNQT